MSDSLKKVVGIALVVVATIYTFGAASGAAWAAVAAWIVPTMAIAGNLLLATIKPGASESFGSSLQLSGDTTAAVQLIYGEAWTAGVLRYRDVMGVNNQDLYLVIVLAGHSCDSVPAVTADKNLLTLDGSGNVTAPSQYVGLLNIRYVMGSDTQAADSTLTSVFAGKWTTNHRLRGRTYAIVKMTFDETNMSGVPQFLFKVRGRKVYDPRKDSTNGGTGAHRLATESTWEWSENAVLCLNDYDRGVMINAKREAGVGIPTTRFDWGNVIAEANICDEAVALAVGGTEKRYTTNGIIDMRQDHNTVRALFESAFAGDAIFSDAKWRYFTGAYRTPTLSLLPDNFIGALKHTVFTGEKDRFDAMQGRYSSSAEYGQIVDYAPVRLASATVGAERFTSMDFQLINDVIAGVGTDGGARAQRVATLLLQKQSAGKRIQCTTNLYGLRAMPGETIQVTHAAFGLTTQTMRVLEVQLRPVQDGDKTGLVVDLTLEAGPSSLYSWSAAETAIAASPSLPQLVVPPARIPWTPVLTNVTRLNNTFTKTGGTAAWDGAFSSQETYPACIVSAVVPATSQDVMIGLNSDPTTDANYTSIDHALHQQISGGAAYKIYESGSLIATVGGTPAIGDLLAVTYDGQTVIYWINGASMWRTQRFGARLYADSSLFQIGSSLSNVSFAPYGDQRAVLDELRDDFQYVSTTDFSRLWNGVSINGEISFLTGVTDAPAGTAIRTGNNSGDDEQWRYLDRLMPYDGVSLYEIGCLTRKNSGAGTFFCGLEGVSVDGVTMIDSTGANSHSSQYFLAASGATPGAGWTTYRGYVRGWSGSPSGGVANDSSSPQTLRTSVAFVRPVFITNYNVAAGQMDIAAIWVRRLGGALNAKNTVNTPEIDANAATLTHLGQASAVSITQLDHTGPIQLQAAVQVTFTPTVSCTLRCTMTSAFTYIAGGGGASSWDGRYYVYDDASAPPSRNNLPVPNTASVTTHGAVSQTIDISCTGGASITIDAGFSKLNSTDTLTIDQIELSVVEMRR